MDSESTVALAHPTSSGVAPGAATTLDLALDVGMSQNTPISIDSPPSQPSIPRRNHIDQTLLAKNETISTPTPPSSGHTISGSRHYLSIKERSSISPKSIAVNSETMLQPEHVAFMKVVAILLKDQPFSYTEDFVSEVSNLAATYFDELSNTLHDFTEMQRRRRALKSDMQMTLQTHRISPGDLYDQLEKLKTIKNRSQNELQIINENLKAMEAQVEPIPESRVFFDNEHYDIAELVPKQNESRPSYIPLYFPELPPDHTYQNTPNYLQRLSDLKEMRLRLVEQSRLTEKLLYNLIDDDEVKWRKNFELELAEINDNDENLGEITEESIIKEVEKPEPIKEEEPQFETLGSNLGKSQPFDIVAYAQKRLELRNRQEADARAKAEKRKKNVCMQAEEYFSPYAQKRPTKAVKDYFNQIMEREFTATIQSIRKDSKRREKKLKLIMEIKRRKDAEREQARESEEVKFGIDFGRMGQSDDDDDESDKELNDNFPQFDFPSIGVSSESTNKGGNDAAIDSQMGRTDSVKLDGAASESTQANNFASQGQDLPTDSNIPTDVNSGVVANGEISDDSEDDLFDDIVEEKEAIKPLIASNVEKLKSDDGNGADQLNEHVDLEEQLNRELEQDIGGATNVATTTSVHPSNGIGALEDDGSDLSDDFEEV